MTLVRKCEQSAGLFIPWEWRPIYYVIVCECPGFRVSCVCVCKCTSCTQENAGNTDIVYVH